MVATVPAHACRIEAITRTAKNTIYFERIVFNRQTFALLFSYANTAKQSKADRSKRC
jgi:hypothetical protein